MRVCYFGTYRADYSRNMKMIAGLRSAGMVVGYLGHLDVLLARRLSHGRKKPLLWGVLVSMVLLTLDRGIGRSHPFSVRLLRTIERRTGHRVHRLGAQIGLIWKSAVEEHRWAFSRKALPARIERCGLLVEKHEYFLMRGNRLFVCNGFAGAKGVS